MRFFLVFVGLPHLNMIRNTQIPYRQADGQTDTRIHIHGNVKNIVFYYIIHSYNKCIFLISNKSLYVNF